MGSQQQHQQSSSNSNNNNNNNNKPPTPPPPPTTTITENCPPVFVGSNYNTLILNIREDIRGEYSEIHNEEFHNLCFFKWYSIVKKDEMGGQ